MFDLGDILEADDRRAKAGKHFIIYYGDHDGTNFIGAMVTHFEDLSKNRLMDETHFEKKDKSGNQYKFQYNRTFIVVAKLIKFSDWGPFIKIGKLSKDGIAFVVKCIEPLQEETWENYLSRTKND